MQQACIIVYWMYDFHFKAPGGSIILEGEKPKTSICVFEANEDTETLRCYVQVNKQINMKIKW